MFLVQSYLGQEEGQTTMVDNVLMTAPAQTSHNTMELTASATQVTNHIQKITDTDTENNYEDENSVERSNYDRDDNIDSPENLDDSDGDIGPYFDAVLDEEDIEYSTEKANNKRGGYDVKISSAGSSEETRESKTN